jgi:microcompartment protein CcmL/EutN
MVETIGFLETTSIAKGVEAADALLKAAEVRLLFAKPICPGKYIVLFCGDVAAVKSSLEAGVRIAKDTVVDTVVIPRVDPQVIAAINTATAVDGFNAVGVMEFFSITAAVYAADAAAKAAEVTLMDVRLGTRHRRQVLRQSDGGSSRREGIRGCRSQGSGKERLCRTERRDPESQKRDF